MFIFEKKFKLFMTSVFLTIKIIFMNGLFTYQFKLLKLMSYPENQMVSAGSRSTFERGKLTLFPAKSSWVNSPSSR